MRLLTTINYNIFDFISSMQSHSFSLHMWIPSLTGVGEEIILSSSHWVYWHTSMDLISAITPSGKQQQMSPNRASPRKSLGGGGLSPPSPVARPLSQIYTMCFPEGWREGMWRVPIILHVYMGKWLHMWRCAHPRLVGEYHMKTRFVPMFSVCVHNNTQR